LFRAHPLLFQGLLSLVYRVSMSDYLARMLSVAFGVGTVWAGFWAARQLYTRRVALIAAAILAVMPYMVVVSRQVLLDGPMVFFGTVALGLTARFARSRDPGWLYGAAVALGLTFLTKETGILLAGAMFAFIILTPHLRVRTRDILVSGAIIFAFVIVFPLASALGKRSHTSEQFFLWQVVRRPNHGLTFYLDHVPQALGLGVVVLAVIGLLALRRDRTWRESLLLCWIVVPTVFFVLWPVKGYQYLLPIAPAVAILAARPLAALPVRGRFRLHDLRAPAIVVTALIGALVALSLLVPTWRAITPSEATTVNAGAGGAPGGREAGRWIGATAPIGAKVITIGPSMSNLIRYFGGRESFGLSVSTNPLHRNPVYEPVVNADLRLRRGEIQYLVWDATSASRAPGFASQLLDLAHRYHGRVVHRV
jgi:4-amino-4-deoxy-L-arabinose transferase-like glycosyltransferase